MCTDSIGILFGNENGTFEKQRFLSTGLLSHPSSITIADFNGDSQLDIAVTSHGSKTVDIFFKNGSEQFKREINEKYHFQFAAISITHGDFNNDGQSEILIGYDGSDNVEIYAPYHASPFADQTTYSTGSRPYSVSVGDFNNDTHLDIVLVNSGDNNISLLLGYGDGSFANQTTYSTGSISWFVAVGDSNNDTHLGIVVTNYGDSNISVLLGYRDGSFADRTTYSTGSNP